VYVDDSAAERRLMMHYLRGTALRLRTAEGGEEGLKLLEEGCDLIITDLDMPDMSGPEMVWAMRESGYSTPVVMVTADANAISKLNLVELRVSAFIAKPFSQDIVLRAIAEFISQDSGSRQSCSSLAEDHPNRGLVDTFVAQLREFAKRLVTCMERGDAGACRSIALQVAGSAPNFGFEAIAKLAQAAAKHLASSMSVTESNIPLRSVITACERAKA
jgi:CheY-like chemotaxis protein